MKRRTMKGRTMKGRTRKGGCGCNNGKKLIKI